VLTVTATNGEVEVSWPRLSINMALETASDVGAAASWNTVNTPPEPVGVNFVVTLPATGHTGYFRLPRL
jgi:hypothetical protein